jgi:putative ATP-dependent endonuclease of OLD family
MKIKSLYLKNFRSFKDELIEFPKSDLCAFVGENNAGKSNILNALNLMLGEKYPMYYALADNDFYGWKRDKELRIKIDFDSNQEGYNSIELIYDPLSKEEEFKYLLTRNSSSHRPTSEQREKFGFIYISAERDLLYQLTYSKWTLFGKIAEKLQESFKEKDIHGQNSKKVEEYFTDTTKFLRENSNLKEFENNLKNSYNQLFIEGQTQLIFKSFDPINYFQSLLLSVNEFGKDIYPRDLGMGARNLLFLALFKAYAETFRPAGDLIVIEEPELYLHYSWRSFLYETLKKLAEKGAQIIYSTHSEDFIDIGRFDDIKVVRKIQENQEIFSKVYEPDIDALLEERRKEYPDTNLEQIKQYFSKLGTLEHTARRGFFSKKIILVEGPTEALSLPIFFQAKGIDLDKNSIGVVDCSGKNNIPTFLSLFKNFKIEPYIVWDWDNDKPIEERKPEANKTLSKYCFDTDDCFALEEENCPYKQSQKGVVWKNNFEDYIKNEIKDYDELIKKGSEEWGYDLNKDAAKQLKMKYVAIKCRERNECPPCLQKIIESLGMKADINLEEGTQKNEIMETNKEFNIDEIPF